MYGSPSTNQLKRSILEFCGVNPVKVIYVGIVKSSDTKKREQWLAQIEKLGEKLK